ncbi:unnamed protein product [Lymnaea stagnalis]|uniref:Uncharacterized protein n=1 Tax=Lymnaea stagnalis TaxID=6523 RepID=A0AAV2ID93_LYMST
MNTISDGETNVSFEQKTERASSDDSLDLNTKSNVTGSDSISSDAESTGSWKSATKLQRTKPIIIDIRSPQLRRPVVTKKKTLIESCEANLRNAPSTATPASPVVIDGYVDPGQFTKNERRERTNGSESSANESAPDIAAQEIDGGGAKVKEACKLTAHDDITSNQHNVVPIKIAEENLSPNSELSGSVVEKAKLSRTKDVESVHRQQETSSGNRRKAMFFTPVDAREKTPEVGDNFNSQTKVDDAGQENAETKSYKPVALPRRKNPPQAKDDGQVIKTELHKSISDSDAGYRSAAVRDTTRSNTLPSRGNSLIPVVIVDDETDDTASSDDDDQEDHNELPAAVSPSKMRNKNLDASDDSDYDNPWDNLDDAVKRASIRYNRRPSRLAAGTKTLLLKSAEDLGRLLEEAEKKRRLRSDGSHGEMLSPEEDDAETPIIPFTRFSPYRHTVKGIVSETNMAASQSTEDILKNSRQDYTRLSLLRKEAAKETLNKGAEPRRPQSMTSKLKTIISSPETKHRKN